MTADVQMPAGKKIQSLTYRPDIICMPMPGQTANEGLMFSNCLFVHQFVNLSVTKLGVNNITKNK